MQNICAVILAAGKGTRLKSEILNKVVLKVGEKPMILHEVELLKDLHMTPIIVVVGFAKESVMNVLGTQVEYVEQTEQLGTASAVKTALSKIPRDVKNILVIQGDDGLLYAQEGIKELIKKLVLLHIQKHASVSLLTYSMEHSKGQGRIVRNEHGAITKIVEEKDATNTEREITEINSACYIFALDFLAENIHKLEKSSVTSEYYLTDLIAVAFKQDKIIESISIDQLHWHGVNTPEDLETANRLYSQVK